MRKHADRFFPHDYHASRDSKIMQMRAEYGHRGYGIYWLIVEYLYTQNGRAPNNPKLLAMAIGVDVRTIKTFLADCINKFSLFDSDGQEFWSNRCIAEIERIEEISRQNSKNVSKRYKEKYNNSFDNNILSDSNSQNMDYERSTRDIRPYSARSTIDKIEIDEKDEIDCTEPVLNTLKLGEFSNVLLSQSEYEKGIQAYGQKVFKDAIEMLSSYKASSGKSYKSDYAAMTSWVIKKVLQDAQVGRTFGDDGNVFISKNSISVYEEEGVQIGL